MFRLKYDWCIGASLTCYCSEGDCVNNQNTCEGIYCYLQVFFGNSPNEYHTDYGCLSRLQRTHCNQSSSEHHIKCCSREKECNRNLTIPIIAATSTVQSSSMPPISTSQLLPVPSSSSLSTLLSKPSPSTSGMFSNYINFITRSMQSMFGRAQQDVNVFKLL